MNGKALVVLMIFVSSIFSQYPVRSEFHVDSGYDLDTPPKAFLGAGVMLFLLFSIGIYALSVLLKAMKKWQNAAEIMAKLAQICLAISLLGVAVYILAPVIINALLNHRAVST